MQRSFRTRTMIAACAALLVWGVLGLALPLAEIRSDATVFGLPLRAMLALPIALPVLALTIAWFTVRQNVEDERFRYDG